MATPVDVLCVERDGDDVITVLSKLAHEAERQREWLDRPTSAEGIAAFVGQREPRFDGR